jgi:uncharacterized protein
MVIAHKIGARQKRLGIKRQDFHLFKWKGRFFLLYVPASEFFEIDRITHKRIKLETEKSGNYRWKEFFKTYSADKIREVESELARLFGKVVHKQSVDAEGAKIRSIALNVAQVCNLRCSYCYAKDGSYGTDKGLMSEETAYGVIDYFAGQLLKGDLLNIKFFGGEPLVNFDLISKVVSHCRQITKKRKIHFKYSVTTNGTLFDKRIVRFLGTNRFKVTVSIDGNRMFHDAHRKYPDGRGSFREVLKGVKILTRHSPKIELCARVTVCNNSLDFAQTFKFLRSSGFHRVHFTPLSSSRGTDWKTMEQGIWKVSRAIEKQSGSSLSNFKSVGNMGYILERIKNSSEVCFPCGAGREYLGIDSKGDFYFCHRFTNNPRFFMGNRSRGFKSRTQLKSSSANPTCSRCWARNFCGGCCYYENLVNTGGLVGPAPKFCSYSKDLINRACLLYIEGRTKNDRIGKQLRSG